MPVRRCLFVCDEGCHACGGYYDTENRKAGCVFDPDEDDVARYNAVMEELSQLFEEQE